MLLLQNWGFLLWCKIEFKLKILNRNSTAMKPKRNCSGQRRIESIAVAGSGGVIWTSSNRNDGMNLDFIGVLELRWCSEVGVGGR